MLVTALQEKRDTIGPLKNLPSRPSVSKDRMDRISALQSEAAIRKADKAKKLNEEVNLHSRQPVNPLVRDKFIANASMIDPDWITKHGTLRKMEWQKLTVGLLCKNNGEGKVMRECLKQMMIGQGKGALSYSFMHHMRKKVQDKHSRGKEIDFKDRDCLYQVK